MTDSNSSTLSTRVACQRSMFTSSKRSAREALRKRLGPRPSDGDGLVVPSDNRGKRNHGGRQEDNQRGLAPTQTQPTRRRPSGSGRLSERTAKTTPAAPQRGLLGQPSEITDDLTHLDRLPTVHLQLVRCRHRSHSIQIFGVREHVSDLSRHPDPCQPLRGQPGGSRCARIARRTRRASIPSVEMLTELTVFASTVGNRLYGPSPINLSSISSGVAVKNSPSIGRSSPCPTR